MIEIINLIKEFKNTTAVNNISFNVESGKIFGLLGPNGAGKTTIIRVILNILKPTSGLVLYDGKKINNNFQNIVGYLPEERGLYRKSKIIDIITYFAELKGLSRKHARESAKKWLAQLEIPHFSDKKIEELSKGNQQKVQFITAISHDPQILILDEPFTGFDPVVQQLVKDIILQFLKNGKIIILSTHLMEIAEKLCSNILLINKGKEVLSGSLLKIKNEFYSNLYKIEFEGNPLYLRNLAGINSLLVNKDNAEIRLENDYPPHEFLKNAVNFLRVKSFIKIEPSLNNIFMNAIQKSYLQNDFYEKNIKNSAI